MNNEKKRRIRAYALSIGIALAVGAVSALVSMGGMKRFAELKQPPLSPPGWLFPVAWTILYTLMGISAARIYLSGDKSSPEALRLYAFQLIVNALWSPVFFSLGLRLVAFVILLILLAAVIAMIVRFKKIDKPAGLIQLPYAAWLVFAGYLNLGVYLLNG